MLCECRGFSAVFARIYAVDSNAASASPSIPGAANAVRVPGSAFQAGAAPGLADPARAGGTCLWPSTTERNLLVVLHVHERVSERFSGFLGDDDGGDSLGQGANRSRRVDPQRTGNDGSVNDVQIAVPENFAAVIDNTVSRSDAHIAPAEGVGRDQILEKRPGEGDEREAAS